MSAAAERLGMATVYLAEGLKHGRRVAIKVLRPELAAVIGLLPELVWPAWPEGES